MLLFRKNKNFDCGKINFIQTYDQIPEILKGKSDTITFCEKIKKIFIIGIIISAAVALVIIGVVIKMSSKNNSTRLIF